MGRCVLKVACGPSALKLIFLFPAFGHLYSSVCAPSLVLERPSCSSLAWVEEPRPDAGQPTETRPGLTSGHSTKHNSQIPNSC